ncbi:hypothetical protein IVB48_34820 [Bradyrhizobium sp. 76]|nr:hypothetical protein [Bradyrhizobium sp. 76]
MIASPAYRSRQVVNRADARLPGDLQIMLAVDHRFALSKIRLGERSFQKICAALRSPCGIETDRR